MGRTPVALLCASMILACTKKEPAPAKPMAPPKAETPTQAASTQKAPEPEEAPVVAAPDVVVAQDVLVDTAEPLSKRPPQTAEGVIININKALDGLAACERVIDSPLLKRPSDCLAPVYLARVEVRNPTTVVAPDANARLALRKKLSEIALERSRSEDQTVVLYTLQSLGSDFDDEPATRAFLETLMKHEQELIAAAAASARFNQPKVEDKAGLKLAMTLLEGEGPSGVRAAACRFVGDDIFRGKKAHVKALTERALAQVEESAVRGTAVSRLGFIGSDADIPTLERLFRVPSAQYAAAFTIQQGLRSEKAFAALVDWLSKQAKGDKNVQWGTLSAVVPRPEDKEKYPTAKAIKALEAIMASDTHQIRTRAACATAIAELGGGARLKILAKAYEGKTDPGSIAVLESITKSVAEPKPKPSAP